MPIKFVFKDSQLGLWMLFHQTYTSVFKYEDREFAKIGSTPQWHLIFMLMKSNNNIITPSVLADWLERDANSITLIIDRMEKLGLVKRQRNDTDHRVLNITMTKKGEKALEKGTDINRKLSQEMLNILSEKEVQSFHILLDKIRQPAVSKCYPEVPIKEIKAKVIKVNGDSDKK